MEILMVGTGYVGLVTGACLAEKGHFVICLDIDKEKIVLLSKGTIPIYEPGLEEIVKKNVAAGRLQFTVDYKTAVQSAKVCFIAVPTPSSPDGSCDLSFVEEAARKIGEHLNQDCILVNKSTVPVGTAARVKAIVGDTLKKRNIEISFDVVSNPEFLKEGAAVQDCLFPDRIVIGAESEKAIEVMKEIYTPFFSNPESRAEKILLMDPLSAEMTKYAANAMLATRISFMNEMADICKKLGANINEVRRGIGTDPRIGPNFLYPGVGYGGSCFPKDIRALISMAKKTGSEATLLQAADAVNEKQKKFLSHQMSRYFSSRGGLDGKTIAIWGLSFKPETDDMREAPSLTIIDQLLKQGAKLRLFDPVAMPNAKKLIGTHPNITWCQDEAEAAKGAHAIALVTEWKQFRQIDFQLLAGQMEKKALFDGRNQYLAEGLKRLGFDYIPIGAPDIIAS